MKAQNIHFKEFLRRLFRSFELAAVAVGGSSRAEMRDNFVREA